MFCYNRQWNPCLAKSWRNVNITCKFDVKWFVSLSSSDVQFHAPWQKKVTLVNSWQYKTTREDKAPCETECSISEAASINETVKFRFINAFVLQMCK